MSDLPPLVADGGELRLARKVAAYVYGRREVTWPDDMENPEDSLPDEREFGWVAKLNGPEPGLSERRFVRGDVQIDAVENVSNVEQVLDDAESRAGGDVFFESMIEGRGLGRLKPGVDFDEGDLVDVRFWGRILPDQLVTSIEWHDGKPSVKIGGQLTSDTGELARARAETIRLIQNERQEREDDVSEARSAASSAQSTANTARDEVAVVRDTLAGEQAQEPDLVSQLVAVNDELQRLGQAPQPSLMLAFVSLSTALWEAQQEWNREREEIDSRQDEFAADLQEQIRMIEAIREEAERRRPRPVFARFSEYKGGYTDPDGLIHLREYAEGERGFHITCLGTWTGSIVVRATARNIVGSHAVDSVRAEVTASSRVFYGRPRAVDMWYEVMDLTIFPD